MPGAAAVTRRVGKGRAAQAATARQVSSVSTSVSRGAALVDVIMAMLVLILVLATTIPSIASARDEHRARLAARHLADRLQRARVHALQRQRNVAVRFSTVDPSRMATYVDGDGDGVRHADIASGVDWLLDAEGALSDLYDGLAMQVVSTVPNPDGSGFIAAGSNPLRIGGTTLMSFTPLGTSTGGTLYLAGPSGTQYCVRVFGATTRIRVLRYSVASGQWQ